MSDFTDFAPMAPEGGKSSKPASSSYNGYAGGSKETADAGRRLILEKEYADPRYDAETKAAVGREIARLPKGAEPSNKESLGRFADFTPEGAKEPPTATAKREPRSELSIQLGGIGAGARAVGMEVGALADMFTSIPWSITGLYNETAYRMARVVQPHGMTHAEISKRGEEIYGAEASKAPNLFKDLVNLIPEPGGGGTPFEGEFITNKIAPLLKKGGEAVAKATGGVVNQDDFDYLTNTFMTAYGAKMFKPAAERLAGWELSRGGKPAAPGEPPPAEPTPMERVNKAAQIREQMRKEIPTRMATQAELKDLQKQVRKTYTDDPEYAAFYQKRAQAQADLASSIKIAAAKARDIQEQVKLRAEAPAPAGPTILTPEGKVDTSVIGQRSLDTGLQKVVKGQSFNLTPEEKIAIRGSAKAWGGMIEKGAADPDLLAAMAIGGVGAALALAYPEQAKEAFENLALAGGLFVTGSMKDFSLHTDASPLAALKDVGDYNFKFVDHLRGNASEFKKAEVQGALGREGITGAEKKIAQQVLDSHPGNAISAKSLMEGLAQATGNYRLEPLRTHELSAKGLERLGLGAPNDLQPVTHLWRTPKGVTLTDLNHFNDPRYFGHTRAFTLDGIPYIFEVQSDLTQNLGKRLGPEITKDVETKVGPMLKDSYKRLIREELADINKAGLGPVRFATADTVAKVEGWPEPLKTAEQSLADAKDYRDALSQEPANAPGIEGQRNVIEGMIQESAKEVEQLRKSGLRFSPKHQSIYNRYAGDYTKFLKGLGAKEVVDGKGNSWLQLDSTPLGRKPQMFGRSTPEMLKGIALVGLGAVIGEKLDPDNPIIGAALGAMAGAFVHGDTIPNAIKTLKEISKPDPRTRIDQHTERLARDKMRIARSTAQLQRMAAETVKDKVGRIAVFHALDKGAVEGLKGAQLTLGRRVQEIYNSFLRQGQAVGIISEGIQNYATHIWDLSKPGAQDLYNKLLERKRSGRMGMNSPYGKERVFLTMEEGKAAGLTPKTEDIAEVLGIYANSMGNAIANRTFVRALQASKAIDGSRLVMPAGKAPDNFVSIDHPSLRGMVFHPDIVPSLEFLYADKGPGTVMAILGGINTAIKRNTVSLSFFHPKSLFDAALGAMQHPGLAVKVVGQTAAPKVLGESRYVKMMREGGLGDEIDKAFRDGLMVSIKGAGPAVEDIGGEFYKGLTTAQKILDNAIPGAGLIPKGYMALNHAIDGFVWDRLHLAFKMEVYTAKKEALLLNSAKRGVPLTEAEAGKIAATYANDIFGGLNWQRIAEGAKSGAMRNFTLNLFGPAGRRMLRFVEFAPDWDFSTTRSLVKAAGKGSGPRGLFSATTAADLYRQQLARSLFYYILIGEGVSYMMTGKHIWEQKDWTKIDLGDGRAIHLSKHLMEPLHMIGNPFQAALNKLSYLPKETFEQAMGAQYLSSRGRNPPMDTSPEGRVKHALGGLVPISGQAITQGQGAGAAASNFLGVPITGMTKEQKAAAFRKKRLEEALKRYRKARETQQ